MFNWRKLSKSATCNRLIWQTLRMEESNLFGARNKRLAMLAALDDHYYIEPFRKELEKEE